MLLKSKKILLIVLKQLVNLKKLQYSSNELHLMGCYSSSRLIGFLKKNGYIDNEKRLIKPFNPEYVIEQFECELLNASMFKPLHVEKHTIGISTNELINELKERGFSVNTITV